MKKYSLPHAMLLLFLILCSTKNYAQPPDPGPNPDIMNVMVPVFPNKERFSSADSINNSRLNAPFKNDKESSEFQLVKREILLATIVSSDFMKLLIMKRRTPKDLF